MTKMRKTHWQRHDYLLYYNQKEQGRTKPQKEKEIITMTYTYKTYMMNKDIEKYSKDITIIDRKQMDLGAIITFTTENKKVLDEIFCED